MHLICNVQWDSYDISGRCAVCEDILTLRVSSPAWMWNSPGNRQAKTSKAFSSVSWQQDDPVPLKEQSPSALAGKHSWPKCFPLEDCFVTPSTLIQVKWGQFGVDRKAVQLIDPRGSRNVDVLSLWWTNVDTLPNLRGISSCFMLTCLECLFRPVLFDYLSQQTFAFVHSWVICLKSGHNQRQ